MFTGVNIVPRRGPTDTAPLTITVEFDGNLSFPIAMRHGANDAPFYKFLTPVVARQVTIRLHGPLLGSTALTLIEFLTVATGVSDSALNRVRANVVCTSAAQAE